ncbi:hypothetical protein DUZ99_02495 [Xylanibacillus composti]|uniref:Uncharacterized protein n=1 Tax=Xylanibacillus composti TaxID=1572762 RepID=A0A8J4M1B2_9BACL|nr:hypothetical protein [Xylanibacillus composti]MDT9723865.1 hypothetical protein [Xylanibacillus composti]GIQ67356.1 hypothetical protein XYCOK13_01800 [Xylanibacillus composti]
MKRFVKWFYPALVILMLIGLVNMAIKNREQSSDLRKLQSLLESYERKESNYEQRLDNLRKERQDKIDSMVAAYKDNVDLKRDNKRLSSTVEELYFRNISNLRLLFGDDFDTRVSPAFHTRMQDWLKQYMDAVSFEDEERHSQWFDSEEMRAEDPFWRNKSKLTGFLMAEPASEQRVQQVKEELGTSAALHAVDLFALTKDYEVVAATLYMSQNRNEGHIVRVEQRQLHGSGG